MKKTLMVKLAVAVAAATICLGANAETAYSEIWTKEDLEQIRGDNAGAFKLMADIDMRNSSWRIDGTFTGIFDGNGHTISNINCNNAWDTSGFFQTLGDGAIVRGLSLRGGKVTTRNGYIGGLAGTVSGNVLVEDCTVDVLVSGSSYVGGFVGYIQGDATLTLRRCRSLSAVVGSGDRVGGLVGYTYWKPTIVNVESCYVAGAVKGTGWVGGIVGSPSDSSPSLFTISNSYSVAELTGCFGSPDERVGEFNSRVIIIDTPTILDNFPTNTFNVRTRGTGAGTASYDAATGEFTATPNSGSAFYGWEGLPPKEGDYNERTVWAVFGRSVATADDFKNMDSGGIYVQTADIDLEETKGYTYWTFNGCYNGGNHEIRNLKRDSDGYYGGKLLGVFEQTDGAVIKNLRIVNPNVVGNDASIGALVGKATKSTFINVRVEGGSVKGDHSNIGGLVGQAETGLFVECMSSATVEGQESVGGLIGYGGGDITVCRSYATGDVTGARSNSTPLYIGGLIGNGYRLNISDSYALGSVTADADDGYAVGGFIGCFEDYDAYAGITNCYSAGAVSGNNNLGGFVSPYYTDGKSDGAGNYWDTETSGQATSAGTGVTGLTTAQMKSGVAFAGWDTDVWKFAEGQYPRLRAFIPKYTVTWLGEDGVTVLKEEIVDEGDTPTCEAPTKEDGELNTYTFSGWEPEVTPVESNTTYTATFLAQPKWTGTGTAGDPYVLTTPARIKEIIALYGASVPDEIYVSTGNGVTSESLTAQLPAGYAVRATGTANVVKIVKIVSVVWKNYDGTVLERDDDVAIGTEPSYDGATPTKASTEQYSYTFAGWTPTVVTVAGSAEYTATYTETLRSYTITWLDADGTSLGTTTVAYGATPSHSAPASAYTFTGWSPAIAAVTGDETYTATFSHEVVLTNLTGDYTAADGDVLTGSTTYNVSIPGGATVTLNGVSVIGAGGGGSVAPAPQFDASGESVTTKFVQGANGKWTLTTFAELANDAIGAEVLPEVIKVYAAETLPGLDSATPMTTGVEIKERASAVKTTIEVTPPSGTRSQFFKVTFDE